MDPMLQRHCARHIYVVPNGLRELTSDITREVLRTQPEDLNTFIADYLDALMIVRENARISAKFVQALTESVETIVELLNSGGMNMDEANHAATVIQSAFKSWSVKKGILKEDEETIVKRIIEEAGISDVQAQTAAVCIQHAFRAFKSRKEREKQLLDGIIDWRVAARSAIQLYRKTGVSPEEAKRAANLIKASYKGYYTRRALKRLQQVNAAFDEEEGEWSSESSESFERKKGVRIDYRSLVPHVDFGGEEMIKDKFKAELFGEDEAVSSDTQFVKDFLEKYLLNVVLDKIDGETQAVSEDETAQKVEGVALTPVSVEEAQVEVPTEETQPEEPTKELPDAPQEGVPAEESPEAPPSDAPPSEAPPSDAPPSDAPPSEAPPSDAPPSEAPSEAPPSDAPPSDAPPPEPPTPQTEETTEPPTTTEEEEE